MKRTPLRRKSKNPLKRAKDKADKELQDSYRREYFNMKCESCNKPFDLMHHHIEKSQNLFTRWKCPENLIFICKDCHNKIHFGNRDPVSAYSIKRGEKWKETITILRRKQKGYVGIPELKEIEEYYQHNKPEIWIKNITKTE